MAEFKDVATRLIDVMAPLERGKGMIVAPPKGKTTVLKKLANNISVNHPEVGRLCS